MAVQRKNARRLVLAGGAGIQLFSGIPAAWGAFQPGVERDYALSTDQATWIFSFVICAFGIGCVLGGALQDTLGARRSCLLGAAGLGGGFFAASFFPAGQPLWFYLAFSIPVGLGCALLTPSVMSCAQKWWPQKKGFATGVTGCAAGLSGAVLTLAARWLGGSRGMPVCFRVLGCVMAAVCTLGALTMQPPPAAAEPDGGASSFAKDGTAGRCSKRENGTQHPLQALRTADYWLLVCAVAAAAPTVLLFSPVILPLAQQRGLDENAASLAIITGSLMSAGGRLLMPWLSDRIGRRRTDLLLFAALTGFSAAFAFAQGWWVVAVYACLTFCYSGQAALLPAFATDRFGQRRAGLNYGLLTLGMSAGSLIFPPLARMLQGENAPHWIAASAAAAGFVLMLFYGRKQAAK